MEIVKIKKMSNCLEGQTIKEFYLDEEMDKDFIDYLSKKGKMKYYPFLERSFFKIFSEDFILKGLDGNSHIRVIFNTKDFEKLEEEIKKYISSYKNT